ncbi:MAG TPA: NUDIX domain-containing protein [Rhizomicrobium sp.]|jgi:predicted NUDIX family NTP pyrophosphohydrolase
MIGTAGILLFRKRPAGTEVFLIHMGGPMWAKRDEGAWSIPKGEIDAFEDPLDAATREFQEEVGSPVAGDFISLSTFRQNSTKNLSVWAVEGDIDPVTLKSNVFSMVWPPKSGRLQEYPEADRGAWFGKSEAYAKIVKGQQKVLDAFFAMKRT